MKRYSKDELQPMADKLMKSYGVDGILATEDGNFFLPKDKTLADDHNAKNVKGEVIEFVSADAAKKIAADKKIADDKKDADAKALSAKKAADDKAAADKKLSDDQAGSK